MRFEDDGNGDEDDGNNDGNNDDGNGDEDDGNNDGNNDHGNGDEDDGNNDGNNDDDDEDDGNGDDRTMPDWVGVPRKRFNKIKKDIKTNKNNNTKTKVSKNTFINLKNIDNLIDRIDKLNPNQINLDKETLELYNKAKKESTDLDKAIKKSKNSPSSCRLKIINGFRCIREIFNGRQKDMPPLETEEEAEKRILEKRQEEASNKNVKRMRLGRQKSILNDEKERSKFVRVKKKLGRQKSISDNETERSEFVKPKNKLDRQK